MAGVQSTEGDPARQTSPRNNTCRLLMAHAGVAGVEVLASRKALIARLMEEDPFCPAPPEEALGTWSEARLRAFFEGGGIDLGGGPSVEIASPTSAPTLTREQVGSDCSQPVASQVIPAPNASHRCSASIRYHHRQTSIAGSRALKGDCCVARGGWSAQHKFRLITSPVTFDTPPGARRTALSPKCGCCALQMRGMRRMCTRMRDLAPGVRHSSWTGAVQTGSKCWLRSCQDALSAPASPSCKMCRCSRVTCVHVRCVLTGLLHLQTAAAQILAQVATRLFDVPYCVVAHSVGTWIAFEMLARARHEGLPMPQRVFFSCFPAPCIPMHERPWKARLCGSAHPAQSDVVRDVQRLRHCKLTPRGASCRPNGV